MRIKTFIFLVAISFYSICGHGQVTKDSSRHSDTITDAEEDDNDRIFSSVEQEAEFSGGDAAWVDYLRKNLDPDVPIRKRAKRGTYQVIIRFIVNKEGVISDVY